MERLPEPEVLPTSRGPVELATWGEGPAVLSLHGAMGGHDQATILAWTISEAGYRHVAPSRPGYLGTPISAGRSPEEQADLYAEVLHELGIPSAAVLAISGGGPSAIHFALRHPQRCWGLVLVSTCTARIEERLPFGFHLLKVLARIPAVGASRRRTLEEHPDEAAARAIPDGALRARTLCDPEVGPLVRALLASTWDRMASRLSGTELDARTSRARTYPLERVAAPTLLVHGTEDELVPFETHAKPSVARIPGAELLAIPGGRHMTIFTHRDEVRAKVTAFLRAHAPERATARTG